MSRYFRIGIGIVATLVAFKVLFDLASPHFSRPGWAVLSAVGGMLGFLGAAFMIWTARQVRRDLRCLRALVRRQARMDGAMVAVEGVVKACREPIVAPLSQTACVAYAYQISEWVTTSRLGAGGSSSSQAHRYEGYHLAPSAIVTDSGEVALLAFPGLGRFYVGTDGDRARALADRLADAGPGPGYMNRLARLDEIEADESGQLAVDWRHGDVRDWKRAALSESALPVGERVCVIGRWDAGAAAIKPALGGLVSGVSVHPGTAGSLVPELSKALRQLTLAAAVLAGVGTVSIAIPQTIGHARTSPQTEAQVSAAAARRSDLEAHLDQLVASGDLYRAFNLASQEGNWALAHLLDRGADPNVRLDDGRGDSSVPLTRFRGAQAARLLITAGADPDLAASDGRTGLHHAVEARDPEWVEALLVAGAHPDRIDGEGSTALDVAVRTGHAALVRQLVVGGALVGCRSDGHCPLTLAAHYGSAEMVSLLLELGAEVSGSESSNPIAAARESGFDEIVRLLEASR